MSIICWKVQPLQRYVYKSCCSHCSEHLKRYYCYKLKKLLAAVLLNMLSNDCFVAISANNYNYIYFFVRGQDTISYIAYKSFHVFNTANKQKKDVWSCQLKKNVRWLNDRIGLRRSSKMFVFVVHSSYLVWIIKYYLL